MEKIKLFLESDTGKDIMVVIIVILVGLGSFELGRLSKESDTGGIKISSVQEKGDYKLEYANQGANAVSSVKSANTINSIIKDNSGKNFFASNRGSKYYSLGCSAGKTIKQENRIYFTTGEEAERAGYTLSSSCN
ncbi:hypothetical protein IT399_02555 [Candidatus Nomurabacteria bacterium]|nr:hypothetical protein [Candidatus Nomurabacteria bacterium]